MTATMIERHKADLAKHLTMIDGLGFSGDASRLRRIADYPRYAIRKVTASTRPSGRWRRRWERGSGCYGSSTRSTAPNPRPSVRHRPPRRRLQTSDRTPVLSYHSRFKLRDRRDRRDEIVAALKRFEGPHRGPSLGSRPRSANCLWTSIATCSSRSTSRSPLSSSGSGAIAATRMPTRRAGRVGSSFTSPNRFCLTTPGLGLVGKVDALKRRDGSLLPYEHKRGKSRRDGKDAAAWPSDRLQVDRLRRLDRVGHRADHPRRPGPIPRRQRHRPRPDRRRRRGPTWPRRSPPPGGSARPPSGHPSRRTNGSASAVRSHPSVSRRRSVRPAIPNTSRCDSTRPTATARPSTSSHPAPRSAGVASRSWSSRPTAHPPPSTRSERSTPSCSTATPRSRPRP